MNFYWAFRKTQNIDENELIVRSTLKICAGMRGHPLNRKPGFNNIYSTKKEPEYTTNLKVGAQCKL